MTWRSIAWGLQFRNPDAVGCNDTKENPLFHHLATSPGQTVCFSIQKVRPGSQWPLPPLFHMFRCEPHLHLHSTAPSTSRSSHFLLHFTLSNMNWGALASLVVASLFAPLVLVMKHWSDMNNHKRDMFELVSKRIVGSGGSGVTGCSLTVGPSSLLYCCSTRFNDSTRRNRTLSAMSNGNTTNTSSTMCLI